MTHFEALDIVIAATGVDRYRWLCSEQNADVPSRIAYRELVVRRAQGMPDPTVAHLDAAYAQHGAVPLPGGCGKC